jgi:cytoskeletal protein CcmA (bactofilin family)
MGQYEGNLMATGDVEITATGRVTGNLQTDSLVIARGGFFNGSVTRTQGQPKVQPQDIYRFEEKHLSAVR